MLLSRLLVHYGYSYEDMIDHENRTNSKTTEKSDTCSGDENDQQLSFNDGKSRTEKTNEYCSDIEKPELELDFANEDSVDGDVHPKPTAQPTSQPSKIDKDDNSEDWNENEEVVRSTVVDETNIIQRIQEPKIEEEMKEYEVKYMDHVHLDPYINDLQLVMLDDEYLTATNYNKEGLSNFWCGVKGTHGVTNGSYQYACQYLSNTLNNPKKDACGIRIGFSSLESSLQLGEVGLSCGYDSEGIIFANGQEVLTSKGFGVDSIVVATINVTPSSVTFTFNLKDEELGHSITLPRSKRTPIFPHIFFKNCQFKVDFSSLPSKDFCYSFEESKASLILSPKPPTEFSKCELIMMVGVIAAGKSTWVKEFVKNNSQNYNILGRAVLYERWRRNNLSKAHLSERVVNKTLTFLAKVASTRMRNYIIDQTNISVEKRTKRLEMFKEFGIRRAVAILPRLSEHATRITAYNESRKKPGADDRDIDFEEMARFKENIALPTIEEGFTEIVYVDCDEKTAPEIIADYKYDAQRYFEMNPPKKNSISKSIQIPRILPPSGSKKTTKESSESQHRRSSLKRHISPLRRRRPIQTEKRDDRLRPPKRMAGKSDFRDYPKEEIKRRATVPRTYDDINYKLPLSSNRFVRQESSDRYRSRHEYRPDYDTRPSVHSRMNYSPRRVESHFNESRTPGYSHHQANDRQLWNNIPTHPSRRDPPRSYGAHPPEKRTRGLYNDYNHKPRYDSNQHY